MLFILRVKRPILDAVYMFHGVTAAIFRVNFRETKVFII